MINYRRKRTKVNDDLDITSFMNLMIILVPVLLINMVLSQITSIELSLPSVGTVDRNTEVETIPEIHVKPNSISVFYPAKHLIKKIDMDNETNPYKKLSNTLQILKNTLLKRKVETSQIVILVDNNSNYQTLISIMDNVRSYKAVLITDVVDAELFPNISLGKL